MIEKVRWLFEGVLLTKLSLCFRSSFVRRLFEGVLLTKL